MTTYTAISATETQSGKPITESLMTRFANNCLAIQEGDPTAPRINPKKAMTQNSASIREEAAWAGTFGFTASLTHSFTSFFDAAIDCTLETSGNPNEFASYRVKLDGVTVINNAKQDSSRSIDVTPGSHTLEFEIYKTSGSFNDDAEVTNPSLKLTGFWL